jgi:hypothetical protein
MQVVHEGCCGLDVHKGGQSYESNLKEIFLSTKLFPAYLRLYLWDAHRFPVASPQKYANFLWPPHRSILECLIRSLTCCKEPST